MKVKTFSEQAEQKFAWVNLNDADVCPDCMAIALQQDAEGYEWNEWVSFGLPRTGHTVCRGACRCRMAPLVYVQVSTDLQGGKRSLIRTKAEPTERMQRIITMVAAWEAAGLDARELKLIGYTEEQMAEYLVRQLKKKKLKIPEIEGVDLS